MLGRHGMKGSEVEGRKCFLYPSGSSKCEGCRDPKASPLADQLGSTGRESG